MNCVLCKNNTFDDVSEIDAKTSEKLRVSLCTKCGLIQQNPIPTVEELKVYYSHGYRLDYKNVYTPKNKHIYRSGKIALQRLMFLKEAGIYKGSLLDVGAGGGEFVYMSNRLGFKSQGIEPNIGYSEYAKKEYQCSIKTGELNDAQGQYDVITMFHVLEHLSSPLQAFEKLYYLLNKTGILFIEVPWIECYDASPRNIFFKAHIFYFNVDTLVACASQYFEVVKVDTQSNLKIIFRAKKTPSEIEYPDIESIDRLRRRVKNKNWIEYLFKGQGILNPVKKIIRLIEESKSNNCNPKEILDKLLDESE